MKKLMAIMGVVSILLTSEAVHANQIIGNAGDRLIGFAPQDTLVINLNVTVRVPSRLGLFVDSDMEFDLSSPVGPSTTYPPAQFPGYYYPTTASGTNPEGVVVEVFSNSPTYTWHLEIYGSGDFTPTISLDQLYVAPDGTVPPSEGSPAPAPWTALSTSSQELNNGGKTTGWENYDKDFIFQAQIDDEPTPGATATISFRLWAQ